MSRHVVRLLAIAAPVLLLVSGVARGQPKEMPNQIGPDVVRRVKDATVHLRVNLASGLVAEGSGFLAVQPGIVVTNAHVVDMLTTLSRTPTKVMVTIHNGEAGEQSFPAKVLAADRANDLAVLRVEGKLPAPLEFIDKEELVETQKVYIFGFPFGRELGKNITVSESSISSLRRDAKGKLEQIQVNGGMHPGNSGGPVVDALGRVIGISVAGILGTQINFAVPALRARELFEGKILAVKAGDPVRDDKGGPVRLSLRYQCLDPFRHIRDARVEVWVGAPAAKRAFSPTEPNVENGDGPRRSFPMKYADDFASADVQLPAAPGRVAWVQPVLTLADGRSIYGEPQPFDPAMAADRQVGDLMTNLAQQKLRTVHIKTTQSLTFVHSRSDDFVFSDGIEVDLLESFSPHEKGALIRTGLGIPTLTHIVGRHEDEDSDSVVSSVQQLAPAFVVDSTNRLRERVDFDPQHRKSAYWRAREYISLLCNAYEATNFVLPNRRLRPKETWESASPMLLRTGHNPDVGDLNIICTYEGARTRAGRREMLVTFEGGLHGRGRLRNAVDGKISGSFYFDSERGYITTAKITITNDPNPNDDYRLEFLFEVELTRVVGNTRRLEVADPLANGPAGRRPGGAARAPAVNPRPDDAGDFAFKGLFTRPGQSAAPTSYMKVVSTEGDPIGQGKTYDYRGDQLKIQTFDDRGVRILVDGWFLDIGAPRGKMLAVGEYPNAERFKYSGNAPGLDFRGKGRDSTKLAGKFAVWELEIVDDKVTRLAIDFEQRSDGKKEPLTGKIRFNSTFE
jgi:hypothetical protein